MSSGPKYIYIIYTHTYCTHTYGGKKEGRRRMQKERDRETDRDREKETEREGITKARCSAIQAEESRAQCHPWLHRD